MKTVSAGWFRKLCLLLVVSFAALAIYTATVVWAGLGRHDALVDTIGMLADNGLQPEVLPDQWLAELLAIEDPGFHDHAGVDLSSPGAGWTTLTQALVKIHYIDDFKPGLAKIPQTVLAWVMDARVAKRDQLLLFLNTVRLGTINGVSVNGFSQAATAYYDRPLAALEHDQFLALVAMLIGPNGYHVINHPNRNAERVRRIKRLLAGDCAPTGMGDVYYSGCAGASAPAGKGQ